MKPTLLASLLLVIAPAACGDNALPTRGPGADSPDAGVPGVATALIAAGDFNVTGVLSTVRVPSGALQRSQIKRTSRCASTATSDELMR